MATLFHLALLNPNGGGIRCAKAVTVLTERIADAKASASKRDDNVIEMPAKSNSISTRVE